MHTSRLREKGSNLAISDRMFVFLFTLPVLLLYLLTQANTMSPAHDSMCYLRMIERGEFFHSHHLLYNGVASLWMHFWQALFPALDAITLIAWLNGLFGSAAMAVFVLLLLRRGGVSRSFAAVAALLPVFSFGVWFYSVTIEVYIIALFFVLCALYVLTHPALNGRRIVLAASLHGLAMLFHQLHLFFLIPAIVIIAGSIRTQNGGRAGTLTAILRYTAVAGLVALVPYLVIGIGVLGMDTVESYLQWLLGYGTRSDFWHAPTLSLIPKIALGYGRSLVGADFLFALQPTLELIQRLLPSKWLADQEFVVRHLPDWLAMLLLLFSVFFAALFMHVLWKTAHTIFRFREKLPRLFWHGLVFLMTYGLFFTFWDTTNVEFWIPQAVMVWMLVGLALNTRRKVEEEWGYATVPRLPRNLLAMGLLLFVLNGAGSILWMMPASNDYYMSKAEGMTSLAGDDGVLLLPDPYMMDWYLTDESSARMIALTQVLRSCDRDVSRAVDQLAYRIDSAAARGARIVLDGQIVNPVSAVLLRGGEGYTELVDAFLEKYSDQLQTSPAPTGPIYFLDQTRND